MLKVNKGLEPNFLLKYKKKYSPKSWADYNKENIKSELKENILVLEQEEYCPYCEKRIYDNDGHIEHIKPRDLYPKEFQDYNNLLVSCDSKNNCGKFKGNKYKEIFINPVIDNVENYFEYNIANGEILPKSKDESSIEYVRAKYTIDILNLNTYELQEARRNLVDILSVYTGENKEYIQYFIDERHEFPTLIKLFMEI